MKILFLTNNLQVTEPLLNWLKEYGEDVICESEPVHADFVKKNEIEFVISYNYRHIIKKDVLELLPHRVINLHTSFLPFNRGTDPNIWSFIEGTPGGVTIHEVDEGLDTGDILLQHQVAFDPNIETLRSSFDKLHQAIQQLFTSNWEKVKKRKITPVKQTGVGSAHRKKDALWMLPVLNYDDIVADFLRKVKTLSPKD